MQAYHLHGREAQEILGTLEQRGMIHRTRAGRTEVISVHKEKEEPDEVPA
jgi:predicted transcriptional regulator of viral defense system